MDNSDKSNGIDKQLEQIRMSGRMNERLELNEQDERLELNEQDERLESEPKSERLESEPKSERLESKPNPEQTEQLITEFVDKFVESYPNLYECITTNNSFMEKTNELLGDLRQYVEIIYTYGEINRKIVVNNNVEIYISPKFNAENVKYMELMSSTLRTKLGNRVTVVNYRPFYRPDIFETLNDAGSKVRYSDFGVQIYVGYEGTKPLLNLVIGINEEVLDQVVNKKQIVFERSKKAREVYLPKNMIILMLLDNIIGEADMLNCIGYVECIDGSDKENFKELLAVRDEVELIKKYRKYKYCNYCERDQTRKKLLKCSCNKNIVYCSKICQREDWTNHKKIHD